MGRLSAQCTDARVNLVSRELFARFPTARMMADGELSEIEEIVKPCGLYKKKAENIKEASRMIAYDMGGELPDTSESPPRRYMGKACDCLRYSLYPHMRKAGYVPGDPQGPDENRGDSPRAYGPCLGAGFLPQNSPVR